MSTTMNMKWPRKGDKVYSSRMSHALLDGEFFFVPIKIRDRICVHDNVLAKSKAEEVAAILVPKGQVLLGTIANSEFAVISEITSPPRYRKTPLEKETADTKEEILRVLATGELSQQEICESIPCTQDELQAFIFNETDRRKRSAEVLRYIAAAQPKKSVWEKLTSLVR